jgi:chaperonin GroEL
MIIKGKEVKEKILQGINLVADTVKPTLGPQAKTVILQGNPPVIINDGVTITKYISHEDPYVQMGVQLVQNLAGKAQDNTGDGTTTACILAQALCQGIADSDFPDLALLRKELEDARNIILNGINNFSEEVDDESIINVATIAANNDGELGALIADVLQTIGRDGIITVEEGHSLETTYEIKDGFEIEEGYYSHLMANDEGGKCILKNPLVVCTNHNIKQFQTIYPLLELSHANNRPLVIVCKDIQGSALSNLLMNIMQKTVECCVVKAPNFGDAQLDELDDITSLLGGKVFTDENNDDLTTALIENLGTCERVIATKYGTTFIGNGESNVEEKIQRLKDNIKDAESNYDETRLKKRLAKLSGGVAVIRVGAGSSIEMRETKERLDDALNATRAALQEGIVVGGGMALMNARHELNNEVSCIGHCIVSDALSSPIKCLIENSGLEMKKIFKRLSGVNGFNALTGTLSNLKRDGVMDPTLVVKSSFSVAMSIAMLFLSTDVAVLLPEE